MIPGGGGRRSSVLRRDTDAVVVLARGETELGWWPLVGSGRPDLAVVDELAWLALVARRAGCTIGLRDACPALLELLELAGLSEVVPAVTAAAARPRSPASGIEMGGQPEGGEQAGVEEVVVPDDPVA